MLLWLLVVLLLVCLWRDVLPELREEFSSSEESVRQSEEVMSSSAGSGSGARRKGKEGAGRGGGQPPAPDSVAGVMGSLPKKTKDLHRTSFLMFLQRVVGVEVDVQLADGRKYRGVFHAATPFHGKKYELAIKSVTVLENSDNDPAFVPGCTMMLAFSDLKTLTVSKINISENEAKQEDFETDSAVGRRTDLSKLDGRDLEMVADSWLAPETSTSLESEAGGRRGLGQWNQFEANKRLYNVKDTYDENIYTKKLDKTSLTKEQMRRADKVARSIESSTSSNIVLREDRGQLEGVDFNEEDMFSGVVRDKLPSDSVENSKDKNMKSGKVPPGPQGAWKRGLNLPGSSTSKGSSGSNSPTGAGGTSTAVGNSTTSSGGAWSSVASKDSAAALLASSVGVTLGGNKSPSNSRTPPIPPGLEMTTTDDEDVEPNISFFGNTADENDCDNKVDTGKILKNGRASNDEKNENKMRNEKDDVLSENKAEEMSNDKKESGVTSTTKLRATAAEWKPNPDAAAFVPGGVTVQAVPTEKKHSGGKGKGGSHSKGGNRGHGRNNQAYNNYNMNNSQYQHQAGGMPMMGMPYPPVQYMMPVHMGPQSFPNMQPVMYQQSPQMIMPHGGGGFYPQSGMSNHMPPQSYMPPPPPGGAGAAMYNPHGQVNAPIAVVPQLQGTQSKPDTAPEATTTATTTTSQSSSPTAETSTTD